MLWGKYNNNFYINSRHLGVALNASYDELNSTYVCALLFIQFFCVPFVIAYII